MNTIRINLMVVLLVGIPAMAVTDFRVWSDTSTGEDQTDQLQPPAVTTVASDVKARRLPEVDLGQQPWFTHVQRRLRSYGATYVRLERWNTEPPIFHFRCDLRGEDLPPRSFEALSGSPRAAAQQVLSQVRDWYASRPIPPAVTSSRPSSRPRIDPPKEASWR